MSEQLLKILIDCGVKNVYGVTGDALNFFVKAIEDNEAVKWIGCKHEGNASYAAFGESETTGRLAVCAGTVGPGALHLVNGLYNAKKERTPVLAVTGQIPREKQGTGYFQEVDLKKVFDDICDYQGIIKSPEEAPFVIQRAIRIAMNQRTVCRIELPADVASMDAANEEFISQIYVSDSIIVPDKDRVQEVADAINKTERVAILAGHGCRAARAEVLELAKKIKAPITHTLRASDIFDNDTENVVGLTGLIGNPSGYEAVMNCDLLLMLATDFPYTEFLPHNVKTVQVDIRPENIGNRTSVDIGVHADIKAFVKVLTPLVNAKIDDRFVGELTGSFKKWKQQKREEASVERDAEPLHPQIFTRYINEYASDDAIFTIETGTSAIWAAHHISFHSNRRIIGSFNHGSMAVGLPSAIGAQLGNPGREVWSVSGDGAFNMNMQDFITAVKYNLPVKILVLNNKELSFVKLEMEEAGLSPTLDALKETNINFAEYARLCGGDGVRVEHASDIEGAIKMAKNSTKPFIIDAVVNSGEISLPSHIGIKQVLGFGGSKLREAYQVITGNKDQWENLKKEIKSFFS